MKALAHELAKLGLSDKEAMVYLSSLELGPSPVQVISRKAEVNRATTYVMIESLLQKGLMSTFDKGKKTFYTAEKPERLNRIVHNERSEIAEKEQVIKRLLPELEAISDASGERPKVSFYEGIEGLEVMRETIFASKVDTLEDFISFDDLNHLLAEEHWNSHSKRLGEKKINGRTIYNADEVRFPSDRVKSHWEFRRIPKEKFPMHGELTVYGNKVSMISLRGKLVGVIIESKEMAIMVRSMFDLAWAQAETYLKK